MSAEAPAAAPAPVVNDADIVPQDTEEALRIVLRKSQEVNGLVRGLSEVARTLDRRTAHLCILATDCEDASYKRLIEALCAQNNIDIIQVNERAKLAEWAGLVKKDKEGNIKKT